MTYELFNLAICASKLESARFDLTQARLLIRKLAPLLDAMTLNEREMAVKEVGRQKMLVMDILCAAQKLELVLRDNDTGRTILEKMNNEMGALE